LVLVVTFHTFNWTWLPVAFPSMGILFALGGRSVAASLDRVESPRTFYRMGIRRLLPPVWAFGAVIVPLMLALGWSADSAQGSTALRWSSLWLWIFPLSDPPSSSIGYDMVEPLWLIRTCLWLVLLSPALLWLFRRWPLRVAAVPVVLLALMVSGLLNLDGSRTYDILIALAMYTCCWLAGFARHDGTLQRLSLTRTLLAGAALMAAGLWYALSHQVVFGTYNPEDIPLAGILYVTGAVLVLLRFCPKPTWMRRFPTPGAVFGLIISRAVTIYLWSNVAIVLAPLVLQFTPLAAYDNPDTRGRLLEYGTAWLLILVAILLLGWVEDLAAARRPRLLPWTRVERADLRQRTVVFEDNAAAGIDVPAGGRPQGAVRFEGNVAGVAIPAQDHALRRDRTFVAPGTGPSREKIDPGVGGSS
jgi:peptidoglycan/LPS O-acetylase OafA/YrhL